ncbi:MAG TPA: class I SAM-dependent methyltransferase, partial [Verrucomicrobiae bacterium]|nr:class I SAM-dependent methyltransferase [Verrucomicrobiae bacterium]
YEWVGGFATYYPGFRWEYGEVARKLRLECAARPDSRVLDVGSGTGDFLGSLNGLSAKNKFALDLNKSAVRDCRARGFNAFCGTVEEARASGFFKQGDFSVVTAFHCLEHVHQPVEFVRELLYATEPGGRLFLSTPYSPMSFEHDVFDVLNHPPHHMTRWNLAAHRRLAEILGVKLRHFMPRTRPLKQALQSFMLKTWGPNVTASRAMLIKDLLFQAPQFLAGWWRLRKRARSHAIGGADVILIEFTNP